MILVLIAKLMSRNGCRLCKKYQDHQSKHQLDELGLKPFYLWLRYCLQYLFFGREQPTEELPNLDNWDVLQSLFGIANTSSANPSVTAKTQAEAAKADAVAAKTQAEAEWQAVKTAIEKANLLPSRIKMTELAFFLKQHKVKLLVAAIAFVLLAVFLGKVLKRQKHFSPTTSMIYIHTPDSFKLS